MMIVHEPEILFMEWRAGFQHGLNGFHVLYFANMYLGEQPMNSKFLNGLNHAHSEDASFRVLAINEFYASKSSV